MATADTSEHVSGDALEIGPPDAMMWLSEHSVGVPRAGFEPAIFTLKG